MVVNYALMQSNINNDLGHEHQRILVDDFAKGQRALAEGHAHPQRARVPERAQSQQVLDFSKQVAAAKRALTSCTRGDPKIDKMYKLKHACLGEFEPRAKDITAKSVRSTNLKTKATGIYALIEIGLETIDEHDSSVASTCDNVLDEVMLKILGTVDRGSYVELAQNVYDGGDLLQWVEYFTTEAGRYCCCGKMPIVREKLGSGFEEEEAWSCSEEVEYDAVITWNRPTPLFD